MSLKRGPMEAIPTTINMEVSKATNSATTSGSVLIFPANKRYRVMDRLSAINVTADAIRDHASRRFVISINRKAKIVAATWRAIDKPNIKATLIPNLSNLLPCTPLRAPIHNQEYLPCIL
jgi:hypothetical protein